MQRPYQALRVLQPLLCRGRGLLMSAATDALLRVVSKDSFAPTYALFQ
jgi:hypothetical protein